MVWLALAISGIFSNSALSSENVCNEDENTRTVLEKVQQRYLQYETLYSGGYHFRYLDNVYGSFFLFHILSGNLEKYQRLQSATLTLMPSRSRTIGSMKASWLPDTEHDYTPYEVMSFALKVINEEELAYRHFDNSDANYRDHLDQAMFDLDVFTKTGQPLDWWLSDKLLNGYGHIQHAVWRASKDNDFIDWLQFVVTTSSVNHIFDWSFGIAPGSEEAWNRLNQHALDKWLETGSYAWLAAFGESLRWDDNRKQVLLEEVERLHQEKMLCQASTVELAALASLLGNAVRLSKGTTYEVQEWLAWESSDILLLTKKAARENYGKSLLAEGDFGAYQRFWIEMGEQARVESATANALAVESEFDILIGGSGKEEKLSQNDKRFLSLLPRSKLSTLYENARLHPEDRKIIMRMIFLREWVHSARIEDELLISLREMEPALSDQINFILKQNHEPFREAAILRMVMRSPALTYVIPTDLYLGKGDLRNISAFDEYNPNDGSWWCSSSSPEESLNRTIENAINDWGYSRQYATIRGYLPNSPSWARQVRESRRNDSASKTHSPETHQMIIELIRQEHAYAGYQTHSEWRDFYLLPAAPIYFESKIAALEQNSDIDAILVLELLELAERSAKYTCHRRGAVINNETYSARVRLAEKVDNLKRRLLVGDGQDRLEFLNMFIEKFADVNSIKLKYLELGLKDESIDVRKASIRLTEQHKQIPILVDFLAEESIADLRRLAGQAIFRILQNDMDEGNYCFVFKGVFQNPAKILLALSDPETQSIALDILSIEGARGQSAVNCISFRYHSERQKIASMLEEFRQRK